MPVLMKVDVDPSVPARQTHTVTIEVKGLGTRRRTFSSGVVPEDIVVNCMKAYLYALGLRRIYDRDDTPRRIRMDLTRCGIVP